MKSQVIRYLLRRIILASLILAALPLRAQAIAWKAPVELRGDSDISTAGTPVDAIQGYAGSNVDNTGRSPSPITIGDTTFHVVQGAGTTYGSGNISFTTGGNAQFYAAKPDLGPNGQHTSFPSSPNASSQYSTIVSNGAYFNSGPVGSIHFKDLTPGHFYQAQIWGFVQDGAKSLTSFSDEEGNEAVVDAAKNVPHAGALTANGTYGQSVLGTFQAKTSTAEIIWESGEGSPYPLFSAIALRDVTALPDLQTGAVELEAAEKAMVDGSAPAALPLKSPSGFDGVDVWKSITYTKVDNHRLKLDLYIPQKAPRPAPLVVYIHGGSWSALDKTEGFANFLLGHGFAVASIDYRLSQEALFPAQVYDCKAAIRWLRAHANQYPYKADKIGALGDSAGGHLVSMLGVTNDNPDFEGTEGNSGVSSSVQAVCDYFGPSNMLTMPPAVANDAVARLIGGLPAQNQEKAKKASPITYVSATSSPFVIVQGDQDVVVTPQQSIDLNDALLKAGVDSQLYIMKKAGHGANDDTAINMDIAFFNKYLR
jgi:acetyl esterase/lipase